MLVFKEIHPLVQFLRKKRYECENIGLVPTMGALHDGHMSLIDRSVKENSFTISSIFVNPVQFNNKEDLDNYPRTIEHDLEKLEAHGCDLVFCPSSQEMYPNDPMVHMHFGIIENVMEGKFRPGHFNGVGLVVSKLFNIVGPDVAYFGQKDLQQFLIIKRLVKDLSFNIKLTCVPTVREVDGLAMSSRNIRLRPEEREEAKFLYQALKKAETGLKSGRKIDEVKQEIASDFVSKELVTLDYFEVVDAEDLQNISSLDGSKEVALCIAAYVGGVRLIDNMLLKS